MFAPKLSKVLGVTLSALTLSSLFASTTFGDPTYVFSNEPQSDGTYPAINNNGQEITLNYDLNSTIPLTLEKKLELNSTITVAKVLKPIGDNPYALAPTDANDTKWEYCFNPDSNAPMQFQVIKNNSTTVELWNSDKHNSTYIDPMNSSFETSMTEAEWKKMPTYHGCYSTYSNDNISHSGIFTIESLEFKVENNVGDKKTFTDLSQLTEEDLNNARYLYMIWKIKLNGTEDLDPNTTNPSQRAVYQFKIVESKVPSFYSSSNSGT